MRTARCYTRVSTEEQAVSGYSLAAQRERLEAYARSQDWTVAGWYADEGASAKDTNRPEFRRMLQEAQPGDIILVYKLDRLTRSVRDLDDLLRQFEQQGIEFRSALEQFDTSTASGRLFLRMVTEIAQWERETISERSAMGKRKKVASGEWAGGPVPFGYAAVASDKVRAGKHLLRLVPDPRRAPVVAAVFERYAAGHGLRAICTWLNDELGARTANGARFRVTTLTRLLSNPLYCGDVVHGRRRKGAETRAPGTHPPLVARELYDRVQALMALRRQLAPRQATGQYPLSGVARCGVCGGRVDATRRRLRSGAVTYAYRCANYANGVGCGDGARPPLAYVPGPLAEARVAAALDRLPPPADAGRFLAAGAAQPPAAPAVDRRRLEADLAEAAQAIRRWDRAYETGALEWAAYLQRVRPHQERIRALQARLAAGAPAAPAPGPELSGPTGGFRAHWPFMAPPERKVVVQGLCQGYGLQVLLYPDRRVELRPAPP